ncbi:hypothetical protein PR048_015852 [Dryococelus australis]|uniref:Uncharacterized protein n=1 Tax=Dryococelus australis TaxID=614101 RepID=A0ABQ9HI31_9NEOP|nr:hypothetical protein PR048_015852 [Dryococelus australis]
MFADDMGTRMMKYYDNGYTQFMQGDTLKNHTKSCKDSSFESQQAMPSIRPAVPISIESIDYHDETDNANDGMRDIKSLVESVCVECTLARRSQGGGGNYHEDIIDDNDYEGWVDEVSDEKDDDTLVLPTHFTNEFPSTSGVKTAEGGYYAVVRRQQCSPIGLARLEPRPQPYRIVLGPIGSPGVGSLGAAKIYCSTHGMVAGCKRNCNESPTNAFSETGVEKFGRGHESEVSMEQRQNSRAGEAGDSRENPSTSGVIPYDYTTPPRHPDWFPTKSSIALLRGTSCCQLDSFGKHFIATGAAQRFREAFWSGQHETSIQGESRCTNIKLISDLTSSAANLTWSMEVIPYQEDQSTNIHTEILLCRILAEQCQVRVLPVVMVSGGDSQGGREPSGYIKRARVVFWETLPRRRAGVLPVVMVSGGDSQGGREPSGYIRRARVVFWETLPRRRAGNQWVFGFALGLKRASGSSRRKVVLEEVEDDSWNGTDGVGCVNEIVEDCVRKGNTATFVCLVERVSSGPTSLKVVLKHKSNLAKSGEAGHHAQRVLEGRWGCLRGVWSSTGMKGRGKRENPEKTRQPAASSGTISTCENLGVTRQAIEPWPPRWEAKKLTAQPPRSPKTLREWNSFDQSQSFELSQSFAILFHNQQQTVPILRSSPVLSNPPPQSKTIHGNPWINPSHWINPNPSNYPNPSQSSYTIHINPYQSFDQSPSLDQIQSLAILPSNTQHSMPILRSISTIRKILRPILLFASLPYFVDFTRESGKCTFNTKRLYCTHSVFSINCPIIITYRSGSHRCNKRYCQQHLLTPSRPIVADLVRFFQCITFLKLHGINVVMLHPAKRALRTAGCSLMPTSTLTTVSEAMTSAFSKPNTTGITEDSIRTEHLRPSSAWLHDAGHPHPPESSRTLSSRRRRAGHLTETSGLDGRSGDVTAAGRGGRHPTAHAQHPRVLTAVGAVQTTAAASERRVQIIRRTWLSVLLFSSVHIFFLLARPIPRLATGRARRPTSNSEAIYPGEAVTTANSHPQTLRDMVASKLDDGPEIKAIETGTCQLPPPTDSARKYCDFQGTWRQYASNLGSGKKQRAEEALRVILACDSYPPSLLFATQRIELACSFFAIQYESDELKSDRLDDKFTVHMCATCELKMCRGGAGARAPDPRLQVGHSAPEL